MTSDFKPYLEDEENLLNQSKGIMTKLIAKYNNPEVLDGLSIDKTDSVLRIVNQAVQLVDKMSGTRLKLLSINKENNDVAMLKALLTSRELRRDIAGRRDASVELVVDVDAEEISKVESTLVKGELSTGVEQLSLEALEIEKEIEKW